MKINVSLSGRCLFRGFMIDIHTHHFENHRTAIYSLTPGPDAHLSPDGWYSLGIHPWRMEEFLRRELCAREDLEKRWLEPNVLAIGEIGLDKLYLSRLFTSVEREEKWKQMVELFEWQVVRAEKIGKPVVIHCVRAVDDLLALKRSLQPQQRWIIHGFRGKPKQAEQLLAHGFSLSLGEKFHPDTARIIPRESLFLETDESRLPIGEILQAVSAVRSEKQEEVEFHLEENVREVFMRGFLK